MNNQNEKEAFFQMRYITKMLIFPCTIDLSWLKAQRPFNYYLIKHIFFFNRVVELTGDVTPDMRAIAEADLIVTTPEKWDGVSRSWQNRSYVQKVSILIIDEIHLLGE